MALSRSRALRLGFAAIFIALMAIGAGAAILVGHANPILVSATAGTVLVAMIVGALRPKWAERAASMWIPTDGVGLALWLFSGDAQHKSWERDAGARRDRIARAQATQTDTNSTKVRCLHCQHVQTVPVSQPTFVCEQCKAHI
jgi:hypothetical protein